MGLKQAVNTTLGQTNVTSVEMEMSKSCRTTTSRKIKKLREQGYVERGCGDWQAYTYYITEKGLKLIKNEEENEHA